MSKIKVGSLFKRPLVVGDPNLVTGNEILVDLDEDNKIASLKERTNEGLSDIVSQDSSESDEALDLNKVIPLIVELIEPLFTEENRRSEMVYLSHKQAYILKEILKNYVDHIDYHGGNYTESSTINPTTTKAVSVKYIGNGTEMMYSGRYVYNLYLMHTSMHPEDNAEVLLLDFIYNLCGYQILLRCLLGRLNSDDIERDENLMSAVGKLK